MDTTYRVVDLSDRNNVGRTAATPELAMLAVAEMYRGKESRFAVEQTDWTDEYGKPKPTRSVLLNAEDPKQPWAIG